MVMPSLCPNPHAHEDTCGSGRAATCAECTGDASLLAGLLAGRLKPRTWPRPLVPSTVQPLGTYGTAAVEVGRGVVEDISTC